MTTPLYSVGTWDADAEAYTPQTGVPAFNLTLAELRRSLKALKDCGYSCHRTRGPNGDYDDNDVYVLVERTYGMSEAEILDQWQR